MDGAVFQLLSEESPAGPLFLISLTVKVERFASSLFVASSLLSRHGTHLLLAGRGKRDSVSKQTTVLQQDYTTHYTAAGEGSTYKSARLNPRNEPGRVGMVPRDHGPPKIPIRGFGAIFVLFHHLLSENATARFARLRRIILTLTFPARRRYPRCGVIDLIASTLTPPINSSSPVPALLFDIARWASLIYPFFRRLSSNSLCFTHAGRLPRGSCGQTLTAKKKQALRVVSSEGQTRDFLSIVV